MDLRKSPRNWRKYAAVAKREKSLCLKHYARLSQAGHICKACSIAQVRPAFAPCCILAPDWGLASDAYNDYINNTKKYLESQGVGYTTKTIYTETHNNNRTGPVKVEQGTEFIVK